MNRSWQDLDRRQRTVILVGGVADVLLRAAALIDLARRRPDQIRGSKTSWMVAISVVNSFGLLPASYFLLARKRATPTR